MEPKPMKRKSAPRYPTRLEVMENRELLEQNMPAAWKSCVEMAGAATILLTAGCGLAQQSQPGTDHATAIVAPIFQHGEGRAATGCEVVNPPVFLSEQDAMQVIGEELRKSGLILTDEKVQLPDVFIPQFREEWTHKNGNTEIRNVPAGSSKPLVLQGLDPKNKVGIAIVNAEDYFDQGGAISHSSVQEYDFRKVALELRNRVAADGNDLYVGTFYDPSAPRQSFGRKDDAFNKKLSILYREFAEETDPQLRSQKDDEIKQLLDKRNDLLKQESRRLLRMQVVDFIDWLKGQGVI